MPTYDYRCTKGHVFELFHSMSDQRVRRCPRCGARARRVPSGGAGLLFKGSGFYITDYRSKGYKDQARAEKPGAGTPEGAKPAASPPAASSKPSAEGPKRSGGKKPREGGGTGGARS